MVKSRSSYPATKWPRLGLNARDSQNSDIRSPSWDRTKSDTSRSSGEGDRLVPTPLGALRGGRTSSPGQEVVWEGCLEEGASELGTERMGNGVRGVGCQE